MNTGCSRRPFADVFDKRWVDARYDSIRPLLMRSEGERYDENLLRQVHIANLRVLWSYGIVKRHIIKFAMDMPNLSPDAFQKRLHAWLYAVRRDGNFEAYADTLRKKIKNVKRDLQGMHQAVEEVLPQARAQFRAFDYSEAPPGKGHETWRAPSRKVSTRYGKRFVRNERPEGIPTLGPVKVTARMRRAAAEIESAI